MITLEVYHGTNKNFDKFEIGKNINNNTYGEITDNGLGLFFTDNETMALWFAGLVNYSDSSDSYKYVKKAHGYLLTCEIKMNKTLHFKNENDKFEDSYQQYFQFIKLIGGVDICREKLLKAGYDSIHIHEATTNYYQADTYDAFVILDPENCQIIDKIEYGTAK